MLRAWPGRRLSPERRQYRAANRTSANANVAWQPGAEGDAFPKKGSMACCAAVDSFEPSDHDADVFENIEAKGAEAGNANVADPIRIDLTDLERVDIQD
jgi:hypothetical protein